MPTDTQKQKEVPSMMYYFNVSFQATILHSFD